MRLTFVGCTAGIALMACFSQLAALAGPVRRQTSGPVGVGALPPKVPGVHVLFSGDPEQVTANFRNFGAPGPASWTVSNGAMIAANGNIVTRLKLTDFQLHLEWKEPYMPNAHGQERGNSGIGLDERYEIQVLDSYGIASPGSGDCGSVYGQSAPLINACKPPRVWQSYDIIFRAPRWDANGKKTQDARVTVFQNGMIVQNNTRIQGTTGIGRGSEGNSPGGIILQYHGNPMSFRNIWVVSLPLSGAAHY
ncbi:MAG: DUF1080 domain-containing protein [Armatimonadetes bacterium]|nr:DUF1080 domain-containing protein [Armatimonadota bacterium]MDE2205587.1 DUF1080 domain-containing protein [Armatimonadota bacterium]